APAFRRRSGTHALGQDPRDAERLPSRGRARRCGGEPAVTVRRQRVAVARSAEPAYPRLAPFDPGERFPEMPAGAAIAASRNPVYAAVRESLHRLGLDEARFGTPQWNPLGDLVGPGARVLLKPNLVRHENHGPGGTDCLVTHGSVVRAVLDYVLLALQGTGAVWIGDSPVQGCDFERVV